MGWYSHALFSETGNYPKVMIDTVGANSQNENRRKSRLPVFTEEEIAYIRGTSDFLGLNYYTSGFAELVDVPYAHNPSRDRDQGTRGSSNSSWPVAASSWLRSVPEGLRALLK